VIARARSFGRVATDYERGRPEWPEEVIERAATVLRLGPDASVVDLAAGTGKLTRRLAHRFDRVVAVEPDDEMRALIEACAPDVVVVAGAAEGMPVPDASADAVFVGDAFHWFDIAAALREIARVLHPGGGLAVVISGWGPNDFEPPLPKALVETLTAAYNRAERVGGPRYGSDEWNEAFTAASFPVPSHEAFHGEAVLSADEAVGLWLSVSSVASLPDDERETVADELRTRLTGPYRLQIATDLYWTRLAS
jgi:ubiquinone/menaquinone biosynthesis C-methylase UbiE